MSSRPLRIGIVCFSSYGGSGVVAAELARGLAKRGHTIHVIASAPPSRTIYDAAPVFFHEVSTADYPVFDQPPHALAVASKIVEVAEDHDLDLVHAHYAVPHATSAYLAKQVLGASRLAVVTTLHGTDVTGVGTEPSLQRINRFSVMASDGVTVPSAYLGDVARRTLQLGDDRDIEVIPNFVDTDHFRPAEPQDRQVLAALFPGDQPALQPDERILVHVSNFRPVKRVPDVIEVFARVAEQRPARLLLVGDGPERGLVARRVRALGLQQRVCFLGSMVEFADYLRHADLFLLPSETESFGLAALEALACGVPVLASDVGGLPTVVQDGQTGHLTPVRDVQAMSEAALSLLEDESARKAMAVRARQDVLQRFSQGPALDRYERYYRRVLSEHQCQETP